MSTPLEPCAVQQEADKQEAQTVSVYEAAQKATLKEGSRSKPGYVMESAIVLRILDSSQAARI